MTGLTVKIQLQGIPYIGAPDFGLAHPGKDLTRLQDRQVGEIDRWRDGSRDRFRSTPVRMNQERNESNQRQKCHQDEN